MVGELARHLSEGRLTLVEYEERAGQAYAARTIGDLLPLTSDLPGQPSLPSATLPARGD